MNLKFASLIFGKIYLLIFSRLILETFRHEMITRHYAYPEASRNRPKIAERKSRFQYL